MPVDWDALGDELDEIVDEAGEQTDAALSSKISSLTKMTDEEVESLLPKQADVKRLVELMKIVKSDTEKNTKVRQISDNIEQFGKVILVLLDKFV